ncbi:MAG TPA: hypothetical protein VFI53_20860 [Myxococcaceae bacterium]|nr:hypothetical protein [Myxococcaceae bacterium]
MENQEPPIGNPRQKLTECAECLASDLLTVRADRRRRFGLKRDLRNTFEDREHPDQGPEVSGQQHPQARRIQPVQETAEVVGETVEPGIRNGFPLVATSAEHHRIVLPLALCQESPRQRRFPDTGRTVQQDGDSLFVLHATQGLSELGEFHLTADERWLCRTIVLLRDSARLLPDDRQNLVPPGTSAGLVRQERHAEHRKVFRDVPEAGDEMRRFASLPFQLRLRGRALEGNASG